ncbi:hypothetical protein AB0389_31300, partial [Streptomyces sp. NPDC093109]
MPDDHEKSRGATPPQARTADDVAAEMSAGGASTARESAKKEPAKEPAKKTTCGSVAPSGATPLTESGTPDGSGSAAQPVTFSVAPKWGAWPPGPVWLCAPCRTDDLGGV